MVAYELTHGRTRRLAIEEHPRQSILESLGSGKNENSKCPFSWPRTAITQPILTQSVFEINSYPPIHQKGSIDLTPFIKEDRFLESGLDGCLYQRDEEEEVVQFIKPKDTKRNQTYKLTPTTRLQSSIPLTTKHSIDSDSDDDSPKLNISDRLTGDFLSMLGAFKFLSNEAKGVKPNKAGSHIDPMAMSSDEPPLSAMDLMEKGAEFGSARALYNIGVAYDRMQENKLAREYYSKASDLGHPLATYNCAVFLLKDGDITGGLSMMQVAAENGVPEARKILSKNKTA